MISEFFIFDGINSIDKNLYNVRIDSGLINNPIYGGQEIVEEEIAGRENPLLVRTRKNPIEFEVTFTPIDRNGQSKIWTPEFRYEMAQWLIHDDYRPFQTYDDLGKYYYVMCTNPWDIETTGSNKGYIRVNFRSNAYHAWSPVHYNEFNLSNNTTLTITLENKGNIHKYYYPKIEIVNLDSNQEIILKNLSDNGREFRIKDLHLNEVVGFDNDKEIIVSSLEYDNIYRLSDFNKNWLRLVYGKNRIQITGKCILKVKSQFPVIR